MNVPVLRSQIVCLKSTNDNFRITQSSLLDDTNLGIESKTHKQIISTPKSQTPHQRRVGEGILPGGYWAESITTNSPFKERFLSASSNSAGVPRRNSSNFLVNSRARTTRWLG